MKAAPFQEPQMRAMIDAEQEVHMHDRQGGKAAELVFKSATGCAIGSAALYGAVSPLAGAEITFGYQGTAALIGAAVGAAIAWHSLKSGRRP